MIRQITAEYDDKGIYVYQAFNPKIVDEALNLGTFGPAFSLTRMTWIKPSFGWMLYRSGYASKKNQTRIVRVKLTHQGFQDILRQSVPSHFDPERFDSNAMWQQTLQQSDVRSQWDPERDLRIQKMDKRAIQLGIRGSVVERYVNDWLLSIEDRTNLAHRLEEDIKKGRKLTDVETPRHYPVEADIAQILGIQTSHQ